MLLSILSLQAPARAGYADASDGLPTYLDRETFLWSNAVRIDPAGFEDDYPCSFSSFTATEQSSQEPLLFHEGLAAAASYHSNDMEDENYFDHDSIDGTPWDDRIFQYYSGFTIGENIAYNYSSPYAAVIEGWMCSSGHRANLMSPDFAELGTGVAGDYYTQDFGNRGGIIDRGMAMGLHQPEEPDADVALVVDWDGPSAPDAIYVVIGDPDDGIGERLDLSLIFGADDRGLYSVSTAALSGCQAYYFVAEIGASRETWPEEGSYGFGSCDWDDAGAGWLDLQLPEPDDGTTPTGDDDDDDTPTGDDDDDAGDDDDDDDDDDQDTADTGDKAIIPPGCTCDAGSPALIPHAWLALVLFASRRRTG